MKKTKKAKEIILTVKHHTFIKYQLEYICPTCKKEIIGCDLKLNVTQFLCDCGQELKIIKRNIIKSEF